MMSVLVATLCTMFSWASCSEDPIHPIAPGAVQMRSIRLRRWSGGNFGGAICEWLRKKPTGLRERILRLMKNLYRRGFEAALHPRVRGLTFVQSNSFLSEYFTEDYQIDTSGVVTNAGRSISKRYLKNSPRLLNKLQALMIEDQLAGTPAT
jgi:hypothetical protein